MQPRNAEDSQRFAKQLREALNAMQGALEILRVSRDEDTRRRMQEVLERQLATLVQLIAQYPAGGTAPAAAAQPAPEPTGVKVLVVDDNTDSAEVLAALLEQLGHFPNVAFDGRQALDKAAALRPDVVFLDLALPDMSGFDVARKLRADPSFDGMRIIGLTGFGSEEHRARSTAAGLDDYVVKPVDIDVLVALLRPR